MTWEPSRDLRTWQQRLERLSAPQPEPWSPAIDVYETPQSYVVVAELPGLAREQIELALEAARLTIRGSRADRRPAAEIVHFHQVERGHGAFARTFEFVDHIDVEGVSAELADGVLYVTLPKQPAPAARRIDVR